MKKIITVILSVGLLFVMCVPAMAIASPSGTTQYNVQVTPDDASKGTVTKEVQNDGSVKLIATVKPGETFQGWKITGGQYTIVSGSLTSTELVIMPASDLTVVADFTPGDASSSGATNSGDVSPKTNDSTYAGVIALSAVVLAAMAIVVIKKRAFN